MSDSEVIQRELPGIISIKDVFSRPWGDDVDIIRDEELEAWLTKHHVEDEIFIEVEDAVLGPWSFAFGPFEIKVSLDVQGSIYAYTAELYFKVLGIKKKILTFSIKVDTSKGEGHYCYNANVIGIVKGKICILYENKTFYFYFKLDAFGKIWEKKVKLFSI